MNQVGYRNRFHQARQTMPRLDSSKAETQPRASESNEPSPPAVTPDPANSPYPSSKASSIEVFRQWVEDDLTSAEDISKEMGISKGTVSKLAKRGIKEGWLKKVGREYALV
jgi:hypothetical protein